MAVCAPSPFAADDRAVARPVRDPPLATPVTPQAPGPLVTHLPPLCIAGCEAHGKA